MPGSTTTPGRRCSRDSEHPRVAFHLDHGADGARAISALAHPHRHARQRPGGRGLADVNAMRTIVQGIDVKNLMQPAIRLRRTGYSLGTPHPQRSRGYDNGRRQQLYRNLATTLPHHTVT